MQIHTFFYSFTEYNSKIVLMTCKKSVRKRHVLLHMHTLLPVIEKPMDWKYIRNELNFIWRFSLLQFHANSKHKNLNNNNAEINSGRSLNKFQQNPLQSNVTLTEIDLHLPKARFLFLFSTHYQKAYTKKKLFRPIYHLFWIGNLIRSQN